MASVFISSPAEVVVIDSRTKSGTITLPVTNSIPYRVVTFKDQYGSFSNSTLTLSTQLGESFDDGTTTKTFSNSYGYVSLYATSSKWMVMNATTTVQQTISSLTVNQLTFGTGTGWVQFGPLQATVISSIQVNTNSGYINNLYLGTVSSATALQYWGLFGNYNNTVLAEVSTGAGTQELLVFKGSSASDRVRIQTTGNFVVETGVSARLWSNTTIPTLSNATPAFIITTSSNVGIQTATPATTFDVAGTGRFQNVSTLNLTLSSINGQSFGGPINSTTIGLGSIGYISSSQLVSSMTGVTNTDGSNFASTIKGLGSAGYISSAQLISTTGGLIDIPELLSTVQGLGSASYISSSQLLSSMTGVTNTDGSNFASTIKGLGSASYISSAQLISTTGGLIDIPEILSTVQGLGTASYISSAQLISTTGGLIDIPEILSTVQGLGSASYISSSQLISTTAGVLASGSGLTLPALLSSVAGLGSIGYISTSQLVSTVAGLGSQSASAQSNISALYISAGFITASSVTSAFLFTSSVFFSSISTSIINFAGGFGYLTLPDILPNTVFTSTVTSSNYLVGWNGIQSPIQYFGNGAYVNSVLAEVSTGATTQELLFFRGSNAADRIRMQTTGTIIFEPGVSARLWPTAPSNVTPAMIINASSNVGIQTAAPAFPLDVNGVVRAITLSTIQLRTSSIVGYPVPVIQGAFFNSSFRVGPYSTFFQGAMSTSFMTAGRNEIDWYTSSIFRMTVLENGFVGIGLNTPSFLLDVSSFTRTKGLSSMQVELSSLNGSAPIVLPNLISTVAGIGTGGGGGGITTDQLTSSIVGLGSVGYLSSTSNLLNVSTTELQASSFGLNDALLFVSTNPVTAQKNLFLDYKTVGSYNPVTLVVSTLAACNDMFIPAEDIGKFYLITASGSGAGVNLPTADPSLDGWNFYIKNMDASAFPLQVLATTTTYLSPGVGTTVVCDGTNFYCL